MTTVQRVLTVSTDETGAVTMRFEDEAGTTQTILIPAEVADFLVVAMLSIPPLRHPTGKTSHPRRPLVVRSAEGKKYNGGFVGLELWTDRQFSVQIAFDPSSIPKIKEQLDRLAESEPPAVH